jgi:molecular chaperone HtpG
MKAAGQKYRIDVDVERALEVLSGSVFSGPDASIRELIANAADSISQLTLHLQANLEIRLIPELLKADDCPGILRIKDTGLGMSYGTARERLGKIFSSGKLEQSGLIGRFGIGFYSCLPLCSKVEVCTRTRASDDEGTQVIYRGGEELEFRDWPVDRAGTTVALYLLPEFRKLLELQHLRRLVRKHCRYIQYPIYVGHNSELLNDMDARWYHEDAREDELETELAKQFKIEKPVAVFSACGKLESGSRVHGVLYIPQANEPREVRLYSQRILITDHDQELLSDDLMMFLAGVLDVDDLPLVISRDGIIENTQQIQEVRQYLISVLADRLEHLAKKRRVDFRRAMAIYGSSIKEACIEHLPLLQQLRDYFAFQSSLGRVVTIPEYLIGSSDREVIYADDRTVGASLIPLYNRANREVLYMTDAVDRRLRDDWRDRNGRVSFRRLDVDPPVADADGDEDNDSRRDFGKSVMEAVRQLFRSAIDAKPDVELRSLGEDGPPAVLAMSDHDRDQLQFVQFVRERQKDGRISELPPEVQEMAKTGFLDFLSKAADQTVILNPSNAIVSQLLHHLNSKFESPRNPVESTPAIDSELEPVLARFLYSQAMLSSGLDLSSEKLSEISRTQTTLFTALLRRKH